MTIISIYRHDERSVHEVVRVRDPNVTHSRSKSHPLLTLTIVIGQIDPQAHYIVLHGREYHHHLTGCGLLQAIAKQAEVVLKCLIRFSALPRLG